MERHEIIANIKAVQARIAAACENSGRDVKNVKLLLATKTVPAPMIEVALRAGCLLIAENKVQEVKEKYDALKATGRTNHFIGHLQTNKIKEILRYDISCLQSLDRIDLAAKLEQRLALENRHLDVLIQVNTSLEESKFGVAPGHAVGLVREVAALPHLHIKGLMTIGLFSADHERVRRCFKLLKSIQSQLVHENIPGVEMAELSMGMSGDLEIAIQEGATIIRVGTAIFGERVYPDSYYWNEGDKKS